MKPDNLAAINRSFGIQAPGFESGTVNFTKEAYLQGMLSHIVPNKQDVVLEVAAGTCACGRSFAPLVQTVVCLDATLPMLQVGKREADNGHLRNMIFVQGYAEELPFLPESFDLVFSRLAFHHFTAVNTAFSEMVRVLKPGGRLVMIDMEAAAEALRDTEDQLERLRDPSHVRNMSRREMMRLFDAHGLTIQRIETTVMRQKLKSWLALTKTPENVQEEIIRRMQAELNGGKKTGFSLDIENGEIHLNQKWVLLVGKKERRGRNGQ